MADSKKRSREELEKEDYFTWAAPLFATLRPRVEAVAEKLGLQVEDVLKDLPHLVDQDAFNKFVDKSLRSRPEEVKDLALYIDHTLLKQNSQRSQIAKLCGEAVTNGFKSVCVNPVWVGACAEEIKTLAKDSQKNVPFVCSVVNFPLGCAAAESKAAETRKAIQDGAREIDMVLSIGKLLGGEYKDVLADIKAVVEAAADEGQKVAKEAVGVKVIIETCLLEDDKFIADASLLTRLGGAAFVKTSTGFSTCGATLAHCRLMKLAVGSDCLVKAAGGVRDAPTAHEFIRCGTDRIGTSSGVAIMAGAKPAGGY
eukprot:NODE_2043_length_1217_cov_5.938356_g1697_i0.p1 GENE.NODE_2043_length_1217_cov_5.938356_g1697_i0~~NODE_2043_length_1217_cov_5.938356_g1697_i0.p1  ORF type:complete len:312 (+),score=137.69 NODE_2043_length_1217_cov_5.938356_g1697_i0:75-1010(+)